MAVRPWVSGDAADLARHADDRAVWLQLRDRFPHPYTFEAAEAWIKVAAAQSPAQQFAITVGNTAVGGVGLIAGTDTERCSAEIGYWLGRAYWGRGLMTEAVNWIVPYAFETFGFSRLFATVFAPNAASRRVLEKCGFAPDCVLKRAAIKDGVLLDVAVYSRYPGS